MNFNANTFVVSIGEYVHAISHSAPWMHNKPISYEHAYLIFIALHEELFNETFHWSKIDNSVQEAVARVYDGFAALVPAPPKLWHFMLNEWRPVRHATANQTVVDLPLGAGLPPTAERNTVYRVSGGKVFDSCFNNLVDNTLSMIRWSLRNELNKYMGTSREYEWYFEYTGNGILYTRQGLSEITYVDVGPQNEMELIQQEVELLPKPQQVPRVVINLAAHETRGGDGDPDKFYSIMSNMTALVNQLYSDAMRGGMNKVEILIKFANPVFLREMCEYIKTITHNLPVEYVVTTEQVVVDAGQRRTENIDRAFQQRSVDVVNQQQDQLASELKIIRDRIARRNNVQEMDIKEIQGLAPEILKQAVLADDVYVSVNNREHWYKFADLNPQDLQHPVIGMCLLLSNHIDILTGYNQTNKTIPIFQPAEHAGPIGVIPLY